ncbi:MAG: hypothetical protein R6T99_06435, partial [Bacteroidales bacterium]
MLPLLIVWHAHSQTPTVGDCLGAIPVCEDYYFQPNTSVGPGAYPNEIYGISQCPYNCLDGEFNSTWYRFTVQESGMLAFIISPIDVNDDYDWAVYNLTDHRCEDIYSQADEICVSCNSAGGAGLHGDTGADNGPDDCAGPGSSNGNTQWNIEIPVEEGETYVLYISDWTQSPTGYSLDFSPSTAIIFDDVPPALDSVYAQDVTGCDETQLTFKFTENVKCSRATQPSMYDLLGPGGPFDVVDATGPSCAVGGEWEVEYTITLDKPFTSNGSYKLVLNTGLNGVVDACDNIAPADTLPFFLDLGAPMIDESALVITNSTCGVSNGSITGLQVSGQGILSYYWTNQAGDTVGYDVELTGVQAGTYTLKVVDNNSCENTAGPYQVQDEGAPEVDQTGMIIGPDTCNASLGSVTGIVVTGSTQLFYDWVNQNGDTVSNSLDLTGVPHGQYTLGVTDENGCEVFAGPFDIQALPGPSLVEDDMEVLASTCGEPNGSVTGIFSNGSEPMTYTWLDAMNQQVGSDLDLTGVIAGAYTLIIKDVYGCDTVAGPYIVDSLPAPAINESGMNIEPSTCGNYDGSITGLSVTGSEPFDFEWLDQDDNPVGTDLDLLNIKGGQYTLFVWDENTCETIAGPYLVPDEGGAELDLTGMEISPSNCHNSDGSITGIDVTGNPPLNYSWEDDSGNEVGTSLDLTGVPEGSYTLEVIDGNSCVSYSNQLFVGNIG